MLWGEIEESEKASSHWEFKPLAWAASAPPLRHDSRTTTSPYNPLLCYWMPQSHTWQNAGGLPATAGLFTFLYFRLNSFCVCMAHLSPTQQYSTLKFESGNTIKIYNVSTLRLSHLMSLCRDITCESLPGSPPPFLSHTLSRANWDTEQHTPQYCEIP